MLQGTKDLEESLIKKLKFFHKSMQKSQKEYNLAKEYEEAYKKYFLGFSYTPQERFGCAPVRDSYFHDITNDKWILNLQKTLTKNKEKNMILLDEVPENAYCVCYYDETENDRVTHIRPLYHSDNRAYITDYRDAIKACFNLNINSYYLLQLRGKMKNQVVNLLDKEVEDE